MTKLSDAKSILLMIDWQERLFPAMPDGVRERNIGNAERIHWLCRELNVPTLFTEQYPKGLGSTIASLSPVQAVPKTEFSAFAAVSPFLARYPERNDIILSGMETHICVAQTALDLLEGGYRPVLVVDACLSRKKLDWWCAIQRLMKEGVRVTTTEALLFEMVRRKEHTHFKALSKRIRNH
ncbi:MAG: isochorismatase family protein [Myxococcota bacterium]|nr:isochorismatase family protein [Myxococcota bacterium]